MCSLILKKVSSVRQPVNQQQNAIGKQVHYLRELANVKPCYFSKLRKKKKDPGSDNSLHFLPQEMIKVAENLLFLAKLLSETEGVEPTHGVCSLAARGDVADGKGGGTRGNL